MRVLFRIFIKSIFFIISVSLVIFLFFNAKTTFDIIFSTILMFAVIFINIILFLNPEAKVFRRKLGFRKIRKAQIPHYFREIQKDLEMEYGKHLEEMRKKALKYVTYLIETLAVEIILIIILANFLELKIELLFLLAIIIPIILTNKFIKLNEKFIIEYKKTIIESLVKIVNGNLTYDYAGKETSLYHYEEAKFVEKEKYNTLDCSDYIGGVLERRFYYRNK